MNNGEMIRQTGKKGTFVVHVMYRQNATWQGEVMWAEQGVSVKFRSVLELLRLMGSALENEEMDSEKGDYSV